MQEVFLDLNVKEGNTLFYFDHAGVRYWIAHASAKDARARVSRLHPGAQIDVRKTKPGYASHILKSKARKAEHIPYLDWLRVNAIRKSGIDKSFLVRLTSVEDKALSLIKPFDVTKIVPVAINADGDKWRDIYSYFRFALSSEPQTRAESRGRKSNWILIDKTSGAFLGLWSYCSPNLPWEPFDKYVGGKCGGVAAGGMLRAEGEVHPTAMHVIQLSRCIPLYEFGDLTGGKLIALLAFSKDLIRTLELKYSQEYVMGIVITLHGKSSQYNRLHANGLEFVGAEVTNEKLGKRGLYVQTIRQHAKKYLCEQSDRTGSFVTQSFGDSFNFWKTRWLPNRMDKTKNGLVIPDKECYRLTSQLKRYGYATDTNTTHQRTEETGID